MRSVHLTMGRAMVMALVLLLFMICITPVAAIGVTGAKYMGTIPAGGTDVHDMSVSLGAGEESADVTVEVMGFGQTPGAVYIPLDSSKDTSPYTARSFITLDRSMLHLEPGTDATVKATITLPASVGDGGRYAIITVHAIPGQGKAFSTAVNVPVFITVANTTLTEAGTILQVDTGGVTVGQPIGITTTMKNTGTYHYYHATNWIIVKGPDGAVLANATTAPLIYAIIPGNTVQFTQKPPLGTLQPGTYTVTSRVLLEDGRVLDEKTTSIEVKEPYIPPVTETSITLTPGSPGTLTSPDGRIIVTFPQGSVLADVVITLKPYAREKLQPAPEGTVMGVTYFEITGLPGLLGKDATVRVVYTADDLAAAGGDPSRIRLVSWDPIGKTWVILPTQVNAQDTSLIATTNHLGVFAVLALSSGAGAVSPTGTMPLLAIGIIVLIVVALGVVVLATRRRR